jgi:hypothetical protein
MDRTSFALPYAAVRGTTTRALANISGTTSK